MKYIKLFEELKSSTYFSASNKLRGIGHYRRAADLEGWGRDVAKKENIQRWSELGSFNMSFFDRSNKFLFDGEFHIGLEVDFAFLGDRIGEIKADLEKGVEERGSKFFITFYYGILPINKETEEKMIKFGGEDILINGSYWESNLSIKLSESGFDILPKAECYFEPFDNWEYRPSNRKEAIKLHRLLINLFEEKIEIPVWGNIERLKEKIQRYISEDSWEKIVRSVRNMPINCLYKE